MMPPRPTAEDAHAVGEEYGFADVMGDEQRRHLRHACRWRGVRPAGPRASARPPRRKARRAAKLGFDRQGAGEIDALLHPARELVREAMCEIGETDEFEQLAGARCRLATAHSVRTFRDRRSHCAGRRARAEAPAAEIPSRDRAPAGRSACRSRSAPRRRPARNRRRHSGTWSCRSPRVPDADKLAAPTERSTRSIASTISPPRVRHRRSRPCGRGDNRSLRPERARARRLQLSRAACSPARSPCPASHENRIARAVTVTFQMAEVPRRRRRMMRFSHT